MTEQERFEKWCGIVGEPTRENGDYFHERTQFALSVWIAAKRDAEAQLQEAISKAKKEERELLRETLTFLEDLPEDLGRGSLNGKRAQLMHAIRQLGDE